MSGAATKRAVAGQSAPPTPEPLARRLSTLVSQHRLSAPDGAGPGVTRGDGEIDPELVGETALVDDAGVDVLSGVEGVGDAEFALHTWHQLHQSLDAGGRLRDGLTRRR